MFFAIALALFPCKSLCGKLPRCSSISAVVTCDTLFVSVEQERFASCSVFGGPSGPVRVPTQWLIRGVPGTIPVALFGSGGGGQLRPAKIEHRNDTLLIKDSQTLPTKLVPLMDLSAFSEALATSMFGKEMKPDYLAEIHRVITEQLLFPDHREPDFEPPAVPRFEGHVDRDFKRRDYTSSRAQFDITLLSPERVRLFHVVGNKLFVSTEPAHLVKWGGEKNPPKPPARELRTGEMPKEFGKSRFAVYASGDKHYLVTDKGTVYMVTPDGKDKVTVSAIWTDPKRWVTGVYSDSDGAVYGFGYDGPFREPARFYFKFEPKPMAVPYKMTVKVLDDPSKDGLREAYECGRAIWKSKQPKK